MIDQQAAKELREEMTDFLGIPNLYCPKKLKRKFYHLGLPFLPKKMKKGEIKGLVSKMFDLTDEQFEKVFQQFRDKGFVCGTYGSGACFDRTILTLREVRIDGENYYMPSTWNFADSY
jgi:hypothetical protein